jgi:hypothetical protein
VPPSNGNAVKPHKALLNGFITLSGAEDQKEDMKAELQYSMKRAALYTELKSKKEEIRSIIASHCGLSNPDLVHVSEMVEEVNGKLVWLHGGFNVCIHIYILKILGDHFLPNCALACPSRIR